MQKRSVGIDALMDMSADLAVREKSCTFCQLIWHFLRQFNIRLDARFNLNIMQHLFKFGPEMVPKWIPSGPQMLQNPSKNGQIWSNVALEAPGGILEGSAPARPNRLK